VIAVSLALLAPFLLGAVRLSRALGTAIATEVIPSATGPLDLGAAPRRALLVTIQLAILLLTCVPVAALTQPFVGTPLSVAALLLGLVVLGLRFWWSATDLHGHVRAGAQVIVEALARQTREPGEPAVSDADVARLVPGLGNATAIRLEAGSACAGRSLKDINLRGKTGATVIAIERHIIGTIYPTGDEPLAENDIVVLTGSTDAVAAARTMLATPGPT
jgi:CPA2 family monovalent cation:H+ antiporter-2